MLFLTDVVVVVLVVVVAALIAVVAVVVVFLAKFLAASLKSCQRLKTNATRLSSSSSFPACPASSRCKRGSFWRLLFRSLSPSLFLPLCWLSGADATSLLLLLQLTKAASVSCWRRRRFQFISNFAALKLRIRAEADRGWALFDNRTTTRNQNINKYDKQLVWVFM